MPLAHLLLARQVGHKFRAGVIGVCDAEGVPGDLATLQAHHTFGDIDFSELRTQTLAGGGGDDSDEEEDESEDDEDGSEDDEEDEEAPEQGKLLRFSRFVVVPGEEVERHVDDVLWAVEKHWKLQRPGALISISGGFKSDDMHPLLAQILTRGLNQTIDQTDGWVVTSGMSVGVNRLFGTGLCASGELAPCIGVASWSACCARRPA